MNALLAAVDPKYAWLGLLPVGVIVVETREGAARFHSVSPRPSR